jgi:L-ascorbate metabolism protein UlaG (beta-lactamase superfamily)
LLAAVVLAAGLVAASAAEEGKMEPCPPTAGKKMDGKLLKGVVHLRDDDVRFGRKGGGIVFVDPTSGPTDPLVVKAGLVKPDLILITHPHGDHFQPALLKEYIALNPQVVLAGPAEVVQKAQANGIAGMQVVTPNQTYTLAGFEVSTLPAYFEKKEAGHPQEKQWVGYILSLNGARYYVTGDTQALPEMAQARADVVFPLLYGCGGNSDQALKMTALTGAKLVVPVHHGDQKESIKKFLARVPENVQRACYVTGQLNPGT